MFRNNIFLLHYNESLIATIVNTTMTYSIGKFSVNLQINFTNIYVFQNSLYKYSTKQTCPQIMRINLIIIRLGTSFFSFNCLLPLRARVKVAVWNFCRVNCQGSFIFSNTAFLGLRHFFYSLLRIIEWFLS